MADDADRAQALAEQLAELQAKHASPRRPIQRASDYCIDCEDLIEPQRLRAVPDALRCIGCQSDFEHYQKRYQP